MTCNAIMDSASPRRPYNWRTNNLKPRAWLGGLASRFDEDRPYPNHWQSRAQRLLSSKHHLGFSTSSLSFSISSKDWSCHVFRTYSIYQISGSCPHFQVTHQCHVMYVLTGWTLDLLIQLETEYFFTAPSIIFKLPSQCTVTDSCHSCVKLPAGQKDQFGLISHSFGQGWSETIIYCQKYNNK